MPTLWTYVVRYDSGFAPNPFYSYCTLATCKPNIRDHAVEGDWIVGTGSADQSVGRGGYLVYAMQVSEILSFDDYWADPRFQRKKPVRNGSKKQSCGDNIYWRTSPKDSWRQRDSFHSRADGAQAADHTAKDTKVNKVLIGNDFVYFGGEGPALPEAHGIRGSVLHEGIGGHKVTDLRVINAFAAWVQSLGAKGLAGKPHDWLIGLG